jgi:hypothetical protein
VSKNEEIRKGIIRQFAVWAAVSALRSGSSIKSREKIIKIINDVPWDELFKVDSQERFDSWHAEQRARINKKYKALSHGWAAKIINVYLKTLAYVSSDFYPNVRKYLHPPVDGILIRHLRKKYGGINQVTLKEMKSETYEKIISEIKKITGREGVSPLEIEKYWLYQ